MAHRLAPVSCTANVEFVKECAARDLRIDGRGTDGMRRIKLTHAHDGSTVECQLGQTRLVVCLSCDVGIPYADRPNEGTVVFHADFSMAAYLQKPERLENQVAVMLERAFKRSKALDIESFCIYSGKRAWRLQVDVRVLHYDGNIMDAAVLGVSTALSSFKRPDATVVDGRVKVYSALERSPVPLTLHALPVSCTIGWVKLLGNKIIPITDPNLAEEAALVGSTTVILSSTPPIAVLAFEHNGCALPPLQLLAALDACKQNAPSLAALVKNTVIEFEQARSESVDNSLIASDGQFAAELELPKPGKLQTEQHHMGMDDGMDDKVDCLSNNTQSLHISLPETGRSQQVVAKSPRKSKKKKSSNKSDEFVETGTPSQTQEGVSNSNDIDWMTADLGNSTQDGGIYEGDDPNVDLASAFSSSKKKSKKKKKAKD